MTIRATEEALARDWPASAKTSPSSTWAAISASTLAAGVVLLGAMLLHASTGFILNSPISGLYLYSSVMVSVLACVAHGLTSGATLTSLIGSFVALVLMVFSILISSLTLDLSYDGNMYHQVSIIAMMQGWNPIRSGLLSEWWSSTFPDKAWLAQTLQRGGLWSDHYPSASWELGAIVSSATNSLNASKWLGLYLAVLAVIALSRGLHDSGIKPLVASVIAAAATLSPVFLAQLDTNYVDGMLGSALTIEVGVFLSWSARRRSMDLVILLLTIMIASNLKFTGAVYSAALAPLIAVQLLSSGARPTRGTLVAAAAFILCFISASYHPYLDNILNHGHPLYPMNVVNVMQGQCEKAFLDLDRFSKFLISATKIPSADVKDCTGSLQFVLPRWWHYKLVTAWVDDRSNGFGGLFIYSVLASLVCLGLCLFRLASIRGSYRRASPILLAIAWTVATVVINPEFWWARYAPQFWLLSPLVAGLAFMLERRLLGVIAISATVAGTVLTTVFAFTNIVGAQMAANAELRQIRTTGSVVVLDEASNNDGLFTFGFHMDNFGVRLELTKDESTCDRRFAFVKICRTATPTDDISNRP